MRRVIVAIDVDDDAAVEDVAFNAESLRAGIGDNATVWEPRDFGLTLRDRDVAEADGPLVDAVNGALRERCHQHQPLP